MHEECMSISFQCWTRRDKTFVCVILSAMCYLSFVSGKHGVDTLNNIVEIFEISRHFIQMSIHWSLYTVTVINDSIITSLVVLK